MLTPIFKDAGVSIFDVPHSSSPGLRYQITVKPGGEIDSINMREGHMSLPEIQGGKNIWRETGHGKILQESTSSGLLKITDYGGSIAGSLDIESNTIKPKSTFHPSASKFNENSNSRFPENRTLRPDLNAKTAPEGIVPEANEAEPQSSSPTREQIFNENLNNQSLVNQARENASDAHRPNGEQSFRIQNNHTSGSNSSFRVNNRSFTVRNAPIAIRNSSFHIQKPRIWLSMEAQFSRR